MQERIGMYDVESLNLQPKDFVNPRRIDQDFSAAVGMFTVFFTVVIFSLIPLAVLISFGLKIDFIPIVVALMLAAALVVTLFVISHVINVVNLLKLNKWRGL